MNQILGITYKLLRSRRFSVLVALAGLGLLFTASRRQGWWLRRSLQSWSRPRNSFRQPSRGRRMEGACHHRGIVACALHCDLR